MCFKVVLGRGEGPLGGFRLDDVVASLLGFGELVILAVTLEALPRT